MSYLWVASGTAGPAGHTFINSTDGIVWNAGPPIPNINWKLTNKIKFWTVNGNPRWVAVGRGINTTNGMTVPIITSNNGINWSAVTFSNFNLSGKIIECTGVDYSGQAWIACGTIIDNPTANTGKIFMAKSIDGLTWQQFTPQNNNTGVSGSLLNDVKWMDNKWMACGKNIYSNGLIDFIYSTIVYKYNPNPNDWNVITWGYTYIPKRIIFQGNTIIVFVSGSSNISNKYYMTLDYMSKQWLEYSAGLDQGIYDLSITETRMLFCGSSSQVPIVYSTGFNNWSHSGVAEQPINSPVLCLSRVQSSTQVDVLAGCDNGDILYGLYMGNYWIVITPPNDIKLGRVLTIERNNN